VGRYLDIVHRAQAEYEKNELNEKRSPSARVETDLFRFSRLFRTFHELEHRCPDHIEPRDWNQALEDGRRFLAQWGAQAEALGWTAQDLFGLHKPEKPKPNYRRLSRYDATGLIWLLHGRPVVALTTDTAAIQTPTGAILAFRKCD
jgi:hypothetical protein